MTDHDTPADQHTEHDEQPPAPVTGNRLIDAALAEFGSLDDHPAADHHDQLAHVHEVLASVLEQSRAAVGGVQTPIPGLRPRQ